MTSPQGLFKAMCPLDLVISTDDKYHVGKARKEFFSEFQSARFWRSGLRTGCKKSSSATQNQHLVDQLWVDQARAARKRPGSHSISRLRTSRNRHLLKPTLFQNIGTRSCCEFARLKRGYIANAALNHRNLRKRASDLPQDGRRRV